MFSIISQVHECEFLYSPTVFFYPVTSTSGLMVAGPEGEGVYGKVSSRPRGFEKGHKTWCHLPVPLAQVLSVELTIHLMLKPNPTSVLMILLILFFLNCKQSQPSL